MVVSESWPNVDLALGSSVTGTPYPVVNQLAEQLPGPTSFGFSDGISPGWRDWAI
jgi:hypothetical protein